MKPWQLIVIVLVILLLFGAPKLPGLARSLGESLRIFRKEMQTTAEESAPKAPAQNAAPNVVPTPTVQPAPTAAAPTVPAATTAPAQSAPVAAPAPAETAPQSDRAPEPPQS